MSVLPVGIGPVTGYNIQNSLRFRSSASAYLSRTPASASNRQTFTISAWLKLGRTVENGQTDYGNIINAYTAGDDNGYTVLEFHQNTIRFRGWNTTWRQTTAVYRDPSAWYHVVVAVDTTQATAANRIKMYVNGVEVTVFSANNNPSQNANLAFDSTGAHQIGKDNSASSSRTYDGYLTEFNFIDGQQLTPSSFGSTNAATGVWQPIQYTGSYGANGFYLNFSDNSAATAAAIGKDSAPISGTHTSANNWTPNNINLTTGSTSYDSMTDVPTLTSATQANYCVLNPLDASGSILSNANLSVTSDGAARGTIAIPTSGQWYFEFVVTTGGNNSIGICPNSITIANASANGSGPSWNGSNGNKYDANGNGSAYSSTYTAGDTIGVAVDAGAGTITFYKNNVSQGVAFSSLNFSTSTYFPFVRCFTGRGSLNFGQRPFAYTPPSGFLALNTFNLPTPTIQNGAAYMNAMLWSGNGSTQSISTGFEPGLVWNKSRSNADFHNVFDSVRGGIARLVTNSTNAEATTGNGFAGITSTGFNLDNSGGGGDNNASGRTYVGWAWKANGSGVTNTNGSITSTVSANTTAGFSIVTYTGTGANATVGHGLGVAPQMIIVKNRSSVVSWPVYHANLTSAAYAIYLNKTDAQGSFPTLWNSTAPTSTVFSLGTGGSESNGTGNFVAYCFSAVSGYSAFGSYTGNGSTDGPFIFTGFRPRWVMMKRTDSTGSWIMWDNSRNPYNQEQNYLLANASDAEANNGGGAGSWNIDCLSNGFKVRSDGAAAQINASGGTYIYAAFAENPFKYALAR